MALAQHSPVKDIRLVLDRFTGAPRGFAFVHFHSVADASRVLHALQVGPLLYVLVLLVMLQGDLSKHLHVKLLSPWSVTHMVGFGARVMSREYLPDVYSLIHLLFT